MKLRFKDWDDPYFNSYLFVFYTGETSGVACKSIDEAKMYYSNFEDTLTPEEFEIKLLTHRIKQI